jgi:Xaa-Pro dipeptidase
MRNNKIAKIMSYIPDVDCIILFNQGQNIIDRTFLYLTQTESARFENSAMIIKKDAEVILTTPLEEEAARASGMDVHIVSNREQLSTAVGNEIKDCGTIGLNMSSISSVTFQDMLKIIGNDKIMDISKAVENARMIKDKKELDCIYKSATIATRAFEKTLEKMESGMTEYELESELIYNMMRYGSSGPGTNTIVSFGKNSSVPHHAAGNNRLAVGDFVLFDFGAKINGYRTDIARTIVFGVASEKQKEMYKIVKEAQRKSFLGIKDGVSGKEIDKLARTYINSTQFKGKFIHSLGHGIGLDIHEPPFISPYSSDLLRKDSVVAVEPGIYEENYGGVRIEDDLIVTENGFKALTTSADKILEV